MFYSHAGGPMGLVLRHYGHIQRKYLPLIKKFRREYEIDGWRIITQYMGL